MNRNKSICITILCLSLAMVRSLPIDAQKVMKNSGVPRLPYFPLTRRFKRALLPAIPAYLENFPFTTYNTTQSKMDGDF